MKTLSIGIDNPYPDLPAALDDAGEHAIVAIVRCDDLRDLVRLRTQVKRLFVLLYPDELGADGERFAKWETGRGTSIEGMMQEIATLCGLLGVSNE